MATDTIGQGSFRVAVEALVLLAVTPDGQMSSRALAQRIGSHDVTIRRLLSQLRYAGIVEGRSGRSGGWAIAKDPATVRIGDVHRALDASAADSRPATAIERVLREAEDAFITRLDSWTVADLARDTSFSGGHL